LNVELKKIFFRYAMKSGKNESFYLDESDADNTRKLSAEMPNKFELMVPSTRTRNRSTGSSPTKMRVTASAEPHPFSSPAKTVCYC